MMTTRQINNSLTGEPDYMYTCVHVLTLGTTCLSSTGADGKVGVSVGGANEGLVLLETSFSLLIGTVNDSLSRLCLVT